MRKIISLLSFLCVLFLASCSGTTEVKESEVNKGDSPVKEVSSEPIKIGVTVPLSGPAASFGEDSVNSFNLIVDKLNSEGGIDGRQVELVIEDTKCTSGSDAVSAAQKLVNVDKVNVILGGNCSSETIAVTKIANSKGIPVISPTASSPEVTKIGDRVFRYWNDLAASEVMAAYLDENGLDKVAVIKENSDYSIGYINALQKFYKGELVLDEKFNTEEKDLSILAKKITEQKENIKAIIIIPNSEGTFTSIVKALEAEGLKDTYEGKIIGSEVVALGDLAEGLLSVQLPTTDKLSSRFTTYLEEFKKDHEVKSSEVFVALELETASLVLDAIKAGGDDKDSIYNYIKTVTKNNIREGIFGDYYFNEAGDGQGLKFNIQRVENGKLTVVE